MKLIPLTQGQFSKVDDEDYARFSKFNWFAAWDPKTESFRAQRNVPSDTPSKQKTLTLHRAVMGEADGVLVDHEDHDTLNNQKSNLRICSDFQNQRNRNGPNRNSTSGYRGVYWCKRSAKWTAQIRACGKRLHLGYFAIKSDAANAYAVANKTHYAEFGGNLV